MGGMIKCPQCGQILHSMYTHDFAMCDCEARSFVDGGDDYSRFGGHRIDEIKFIKHKHNEDGSITIIED